MLMFLPATVLVATAAAIIGQLLVSNQKQEPVTGRKSDVARAAGAMDDQMEHFVHNLRSIVALEPETMAVLTEVEADD